MPHRKPAAVSVACEVSHAMIAYAAEHDLSLPNLVARMWQLWQQIDQAHGALFPHQLADGPIDSSLENFLTEMEQEADQGPRRRDMRTGRFVAAASRSEEDDRKEVIEWLNDIDVQHC